MAGFGSGFLQGLTTGASVGRAWREEFENQNVREAQEILAKMHSYDPYKSTPALPTDGSDAPPPSAGFSGLDYDAMEREYMSLISDVSDPQKYGALAKQMVDMGKNKVLNSLDAAIFSAGAGDTAGAARHMRAVSAYMDPGNTPQVDVDGAGNVYVRDETEPGGGYMMTQNNLLDLRHRLTDFDAWRDYKLDERRFASEHKARMARIANDNAELALRKGVWRAETRLANVRADKVEAEIEGMDNGTGMTPEEYRAHQADLATRRFEAGRDDETYERNKDRQTREDALARSEAEAARTEREALRTRNNTLYSRMQDIGTELDEIASGKTAADIRKSLVENAPERRSDDPPTPWEQRMDAQATQEEAKAQWLQRAGNRVVVESLARALMGGSLQADIPKGADAVAGEAITLGMLSMTAPGRIVLSKPPTNSPLYGEPYVYVTVDPVVVGQREEGEPQTIPAGRMIMEARDPQVREWILDIKEQRRQASAVDPVIQTATGGITATGTQQPQTTGIPGP